MRHQFVAFLRSGIEGYGVVHLVIGGVRNLLVAAIDRGRRSIDQMLDFVVTAGLQNIIESDKVALYVSVGIGDAIADSSLSGEVRDNGNLVFREDFLHCVFISDGGVDKSPVAMQGFDFFQTLILDVDIVVVGDRIDTDNLDVLDIAEESFDEVASDKTSSSCHKDGLSFEIYIILYHF